MLLNIKSLQRIPVLARDNTEYRVVDVYLDSSGACIEGLVLKRIPFFLDMEFLVPIRAIDTFKVEPQSQHIRLNKSATELAIYDCGFCAAPSANRLLSFKAECADERLGRIRDLFFHPGTLEVHYYAIQISRGCRKSLAFIEPEKFSALDWINKSVFIKSTRFEITSGPLYRPQAPITDRIQDLIRVSRSWNNVQSPLV
jgi:hypothetical protein